MEPASSCPICGGTDTNLIDGYYYCVECGTQDTTLMETVVERALQDGTYAVAGKRVISKKKVAIEMSGEWYKWHAYNLILCGLADEVISLGAAPTFKTKLLWIWMLYIKKFHHKKDYEKNNLSQRQTALGSCLNDDDSDKEEEDDDDENKQDDDDDEFKTTRKTKQSSSSCIRSPDDPFKISPITYPVLYSMIYCALNLDKSDIEASDLHRFIREGRISYQTAIKYVPTDLKVSLIPEWKNFIRSHHKPFGIMSMAEITIALYRQLDLGTPLVPNLGNLVTRYCKELCLPKEFRQLVMSLIELMPPEVCVEEIWRFHNVAPIFGGTVMAYIVVGLKMCFGLDDDYDQRLTYMVNEINDEENHVKAYRIGLYEPTERLFSFGEWLKYLEFRKLLLCKYYQPMSALHQVEINSCLVTEAVKDLNKNTDREYRTKMAYDLLGKIPYDNTHSDFNILPKELFPSSLTPLIVYTEHVLLHAKVEDSRIKLLLSEDFSKYSLSYACVDLKLHFSAASENVITGVAEIDEGSGQLVKKSLKNHLLKSCIDKKISTFVKDSKNDNVLGHYANVISGTGEEVELEIINEVKNDDVPTPMEIEEINTIPELDEEENIFGVNFDAMENDMQSKDSHSLGQDRLQVEDPLQVDDFNGEDRDETVLDLLKDIEYDPQMFNREDVIRNLILRYCNRYKIPVPFEYKDLPRATRTLNKDANKNNEDKPRKPREGYFGELSSNNILKMYKTVLDTMRKERAPASHEIDDLNDCSDNSLNDISQNDHSSNDNNQNHNINTNIDLQPDTELHIEVGNTDGIDLVPNVEIQASVDVSDMILNDNVSAESLTGQLNIVNNQAIDNDQDLEEYQNLDVNDIILTEIEKNKEQPYKTVTRFRKPDNVPLAKLFQKKLLKSRDRSHMTSFLKDPASLNKFNYNILSYERSNIRTIVSRSYSFEKEMLDNFSRSYRYILQTCASIVEMHSYQLFRIVHYLEENLTDMDIIDFSDEIELDKANPETNDIPQQNQIQQRNMNLSIPEQTPLVSNKITSKIKRTLIPWTNEQKNVATKFFSNHIKNKKPPKLSECMFFKRKYPTLFDNKRWLKIRDFVKNTYEKK